MNVGFIGLGNLGRHLAARVTAAGYPLTVHDREPEAVAGLVAAGAVAAASPRAVAEASDCVITCLPSPAAVSEAAAAASPRPIVRHLMFKLVQCELPRIFVPRGA